MRFLCLLLLLAFLGAVGYFAYQNQQEVTLKFMDHELHTSFPLVAGVMYLLGMLSGWTVVGIVRRTVDRVIESPGQRR